MRTLSATLTAGQKLASVTPLVKIVLTRTGQATKTYTQTRIINISNHLEEPDSQIAEVILDNSDGTLTSLDFKGYQGVISYGLTTGAGDEYSPCAPLWVKGQQFHSSQGLLTCTLSLFGIPDLIAEDHASVEYWPDSTNTDTIKTIFSAVAGATLACFNHCVAYTVTYDSEDALIDVFAPKDSFSVAFNESRWEVLKRLLSYTKCVMRVEDDGYIHVLQPTISGVTYNYEYKLDVSGEHTFFAKVHRKRLVIPNFIQVDSHPDHGDGYSGNAEDTESSDLPSMEKKEFHYLRLASDAQAAAIAAAILEGYQLEAERGSGSAPINVGAEVYDYVKITDSRQSDTRIGNIGYISRTYQWGGTWRMDFGFGDISEGGLAALLPPLAATQLAGVKPGELTNTRQVEGYFAALLARNSAEINQILSHTKAIVLTEKELNRQRVKGSALTSDGLVILDSISGFEEQSFISLIPNGDMETGDPPTGWATSGAGATFARSNTQKKIGSYSFAITRAGADASANAESANAGFIGGRNYTVGCWVWASVANRARIGAWDNAGSEVKSSYHPGDSLWKWITRTNTANPSSVTLREYLHVDTGDTLAYFDGAMLVEGSICPAFASRPLSYYSTLDEVVDGTSYSRVLTTDISAGHILLSEVTQSATYRTTTDTEKGTWNGKPDDMDEIPDGSTYLKLLATQIDAGRIKLSSVCVYDASYNPSEKRRVFTTEPTTPYDVGDLWLDASVVKRCSTALASGAYNAAHWTAVTLDELTDGATYSKVLTTDISSGHILLRATVEDATYKIYTATEQTKLTGVETAADVTGDHQADVDLDNLTEGTTYKRVLATHIDAGKLKLTSAATKDAEWYDESGVEIDATHGINIYGTANALTTRATKTGTIQCYVGADGKFYAGAGAIYIDADGIFINADAKLVLKAGHYAKFFNAGETGYGTIAQAADYLSIVGDSGTALSYAVFVPNLFIGSGAGSIGPYSDTAQEIFFRTQNKAGDGAVGHLLVPTDTNVGYLGDATHFWGRLYSKWIDVTTILDSTNSLTVANVSLLSTDGAGSGAIGSATHYPADVRSTTYHGSYVGTNLSPITDIWCQRLLFPTTGYSIGIYSDTAGHILFRTTDKAGTTNLDHILRPSTAGSDSIGWGYLGDATYWWWKMYSQYYYYKTAPASFQDEDDIGLIKAMKPHKIKGKDGEEVSRIDIATLPPQVKVREKRSDTKPGEPESFEEFIDASALQGLALGAIRQLADKVEKLETELATFRETQPDA